MPDLNEPESGACAFCNREATRDTLLYEGRDFYVIADHAPIAEAHVLLIPRDHYPHLAALPPHLHDEFESLKALLGDFVLDNYGSLTYWENGVFGQSVPHAHLHAISVNFDSGIYAAHGHGFRGIGGLQERHAASDGSHYFMIEQRGETRSWAAARTRARRGRREHHCEAERESASRSNLGPARRVSLAYPGIATPRAGALWLAMAPRSIRSAV
jgi:histidine triad (HIT) family protein